MTKRKERHSWTSEFPAVPQLVATSFGAGFLPLAPGTWGAIFAVLIWLPVYIWCPADIVLIYTAAMAVLFTAAGIWASNVAERYWGTDPVEACVDETVGQLIAMLPLWYVPGSMWWEIVLSLALFRFFDIYKPLGIRSMEKFPGGIGMMADDILAAIYSAAIILVINYFIL